MKGDSTDDGDTGGASSEDGWGNTAAFEDSSSNEVPSTSTFSLSSY